MLPEIVLPANATVPPTVLLAPMTKMPKPFGNDDCPLAPAPIRLLWTTLLSAALIQMPLPVLPEI